MFSQASFRKAVLVLLGSFVINSPQYRGTHKTVWLVFVYWTQKKAA